MPRAEQLVIPFRDIVRVGTLPETLPAETRAIMVDVGGTVNFTINGTAQTGFVALSGVVYHGFFESIETGGLATGLWYLT